jgi:hypothetical protein
MTSLKDVLFTENDIIDPFWVIRYLENHLPSESVSTEILIDVIRKMKRSHIRGVSVSHRRVKKVKNCFSINGYYDKDKQKSIEIEICCSSLKKKFDLIPVLHRKIIYEIADTLCHESLHRYQFQHRDYDRESLVEGTKDQIYYGDQDEMFCFAANIAHNIYRQYGRKAYVRLQQMKPLLSFDPYMSEYYTLFYNQKEYKKVIKMIYQNLIAIEQGRVCHRPQKIT